MLRPSRRILSARPAGSGVQLAGGVLLAGVGAFPQFPHMPPAHQSKEFVAGVSDEFVVDVRVAAGGGLLSRCRLLRRTGLTRSAGLLPVSCVVVTCCPRCGYLLMSDQVCVLILVWDASAAPVRMSR